KAVVGRDVNTGTFLSVLISIPLILPLVVLNGDLSKIFSSDPFSIFLIALVGVLHYIFGRGLNTLSIKLIGVTRSVPIRETLLIHSTIFSILLLKETLTIPSAVAIALIILGVLVVAWSGQVSYDTRVFKPGTLVKGVLVGLVGTSFWGITPVLTKAALPGLSSPTMGAWLSFVFGSIGWVAFLLGTRQMGKIKTLGKDGILWFMFAGFLAAVAQLFSFSALGLVDVLFVIPFRTGIAPIMTLVLSYILIRRLESINARVLLGVSTSSLGAVIIALDL
ncbi:MAG: EamA family transporter, partial [Nitrososphaerales archaeon]